MFSGIPRWLIVFGVIVVAAIELVARLPNTILFQQRLAGTAGEEGAKALQPQMVGSQISKTDADTKLAQLQAQVAAEQAAKTRAETDLVRMQEKLIAEQAAKTRAETAVAQLQAPKTIADTQAAYSQSAQSSAQAAKTTLETATSAVILGGLAYGAYKLFSNNSGTDQTTTAQATSNNRGTEQATNAIRIAKVATIKRKQVNLRSGPTMDSAPICILALGQSVALITDTAGNFHQQIDNVKKVAFVPVVFDWNGRGITKGWISEATIDTFTGNVMPTEPCQMPG